MTHVGRLIEDAVTEGLPDMALMNCHTPGVDSVVLRYSEVDGVKKFMQRLFIAHHDLHRLDRLIAENGQYVLGVHNHRYPLTIQPVVGVFVNYEVKLGGTATSSTPGRWHEDGSYESSYGGSWRAADLYEFAFTSGLSGEMGLQYWRDVYVDSTSSRYMTPGELHAMRSSDRHTVRIPKVGNLTAWLVTEYEDEYENSFFYSPIKRPIVSSEGLYEPLLVSEAELLLESVLKEMAWTPSI